MMKAMPIRTFRGAKHRQYNGVVMITPTPIRDRLPNSNSIYLRCISNVATAVEIAKTSNEQKPNTNPSRKAQHAFPLSALPIGMLLRSLLVCTISSNRFLLNPSLRILSFLSKPDRQFLFNVDRNPILHRILRKTFYDQFCAGETEVETKACVQQLKDLGFRGIILTYAKETVFDHSTSTSHGQGYVSETSGRDSKTANEDADIEAWRVGTLQTASLIGEGDYLAIKLTGAGPAVTAAFAEGELPPQQMLDALDEISTRCKQNNIRIIVDAESQHFQSGIARVTLELMRKYNRDGFAVIYNTYQAYLKSTPVVLAKHLAEASKDGFTIGLKLVRGAYILSDNRALIHDTKQNTDDAYNGIAQGALRRHIGDFGSKSQGCLHPFPSVNLFLASHNRESLLAAQRLRQQRVKAGLPTVSIAFGQLHGMSDEVSFSLLQEKAEDGLVPEVYKCSTWGSLGECLAYLVRRAVENRDAITRTGDESAALKAESRRRLKSLLSI